jgi:hypothetical protein
MFIAPSARRLEKSIDILVYQQSSGICIRQLPPSSMPDTNGDIRLWMFISNKSDGRNGR